ncbi:MAG: DUF748 domain-containing protein [Gemmatimonadota bacterium]
MKAILDVVRSRRWLRNSLIAAAGCLLVVAVGGFLVAPPILRNFLVDKLSETLDRKAAIREVAVNPFALSVSVRGFRLDDRNASGPFVSFDELYLNLEAVSLFRGGPIVKEVRLERPFLRAVRTEANVYNFSDLLDKFASKPGEPPKKPFRFSVNNIRVRAGTIEFRDEPKERVHQVTGIELSVPFISNIPYYVNRYVQPYFAARVNGTPIDLRGRTKPFAESRETSFDIDIRGLDIPTYVEYVPARLNFAIPSALLDVIGKVTFTEYRDRAPVLGYSGAIALRDVKVTEGGGAHLLTFPRLDVDVASSDFMARRIALSRVVLESPAVSVRRDRSGVLNVQELLRAPPGGGRGAKEPPPPEKGEAGVPAWTVTADSVRIAGGRAEFRDLAAAGPFRTTLDPVNLDVRHFTNARGGKTEADFSVRTEASETVAVTGTFSVDPPASEGTVALAGVRLAKYAPYYAKDVLFAVENGALNLKTRYAAASEGREFAVVLSELETSLSSLRLRKTGEPEDFLAIPSFSVRGVRVDVPRREAVVGEVSSRDGKAAIVRRGGQTWNVASLFPAPQPAAADAGAAAPAARRGGDGGGKAPWQVRVGRIDIGRYAVRLEDEAPVEPVSLELRGVTFRGEGLATRKGATGKVALSLQVGATGSVAARGTVSLDPVGARLAVAVKDLDIVPLQPYFTERVKILVTGGKASAEGTLTVASAGDGGKSVAYAGNAALAGFSSVDKAFSDDFLKWDSLAVTGIDAGYNPTRVAIEGIALTDFYSRLIIEHNGSFNVQGIVAGGRGGAAADNAAAAPVPPAGTAAAAAPAEGPVTAPSDAPASPVPVTIGVVTLQGGTIDFSDRFIKPAYSATLSEIGGRVSGLSSEETRTADVDLRGRLGTEAPLEITGKINPLRSDLFVDLNVAFKDIDLSPMTPYSGKYLGYAIEKGKLTLNLRYLIEKRKLEATNRVFIDQFTFGDRVDSPDATKLPVTLAVALLKNRAGEIALDVPVSGNIDDPKFSVFRIVLKVLMNLLVKAATSPFALLGAIFGGGEELSYVEFAPGSFRIDAAAQAKLSSLVKALYDRPGLKVEIEGHVDPGKDPEGLRQFIFLRKVKAQKFKAMTAKGMPPASLDNVTVSPEEYPAYLKAAYKSEKFPKPRTFLGFAKDLPVPEMEKLMLAHIEVKPDDLRALALSRAEAVKDVILGSGKVAPERVFLVEPKSLAPEKKEKVKDSRVDFRIK